MERILVTGGSGFIGTNLIESFLQDGREVLNLDGLAPRNPAHSFLFRETNICDSVALKSKFLDFKPDLVVHLAARTDLDGATIADYEANTVGVQSMIAAIQAVGTVKRAVFASSRYVHRTEDFPRSDLEYSPFTPYGASKVETEKIVRAGGLEIPWVLIRPTSIWGPWFRIPYRMFFDSVRRGVYVHPRGMKISKSYGYVGNVVHQIRQFLTVEQSRVNGRTFYVSDDVNLDVLEFAQLIQKAFGAPAVRHVPMTLLQVLARTGDLMKKIGVKNPPLTSFRLDNLLKPMNYDLSATTEAVGPSPYSLEEGVRATVDWILQYG